MQLSVQIKPLAVEMPLVEQKVFNSYSHQSIKKGFVLGFSGFFVQIVFR